MKRLFAILIILCLAGCEDEYGTNVDNSDGSGRDTGDFETDKRISEKTETEKAGETDTETETETKTEYIEPAETDTGSEIPELETETETETKADTESEPDTAAIFQDCRLTMDRAAECWGVGPQYHRLKDACEWNMLDDWATCLIDCLNVSDCKQFLLCEGKC